MMEITPTVKQLLIINIMVYVGSMLIGDQAYRLFSLYFFENSNFQLWQPITSMFMHSPYGIMHIAFNMLGLISFGSLLERFWGGKKFFFFYISCGLGAALLHSLVNYYEVHSLLNELSSLNLSKPQLEILLNADYNVLSNSEGKIIDGAVNNILKGSNFSQEQFDQLINATRYYNSTMVGASGAIYGLIVAFAFMFPEAELGIMFIPIPIKAKYFVPGLITADLFLGLNGQSIFGFGSTGIAHFAHIGGALIGYIMMWYWKKNQFNNKRLY